MHVIRSLDDVGFAEVGLGGLDRSCVLCSHGGGVRVCDPTLPSHSQTIEVLVQGYADVSAHRS